MGCFAIKIIISIHILSFKKFEKIILLTESKFFCIVINVPQDPSENWIWGHGPDPIWSMEIGFGSKCIQNQKFRFFPLFLKKIEFGQIKQKVESGSCSRHIPTNMISNVHIVSYNFDQKRIQITKFILDKRIPKQL